MPAHLNGSQKFWYDANGNMITRTEGSTVFVQQWNIENKLTAVISNGVQTTQFIYDGDGNRVKKIDPNGQPTIYIGALYEKNLSTTITTTYYFAGSSRIAERQGGVLYYLVGDHLGSTALTVDQNGNWFGEIKYRPYGETRYISGSIPTDRRFTRQRSEESNLGSLYDYSARFYSPAVGRFLSADSIVPDKSSPQAWNRYAYVVNNPLNHTDPSGHCFFLCAIIGGAIGAIVGAVSYTANVITSGSGWNSDDYLHSVVDGAGAGALAGGTLGEGTALIGTGITAGNAAAGVAGTALVGSGTGIAVGAGVTMLDSAVTGQKLDGTDFIINTTVGAIAGGAQALIPGSGGVIAAIARVGIGSLVAGIGSEASDIAHGRPVDAGRALKTAGAAAALGTLAEGISGATFDPRPPFEPQPYSSLANWYASQAQRGIAGQLIGNLSYQIPLNIVGDNIVAHSQ